jgi:multiple sugar transport system ATP-binding protein
MRAEIKELHQRLKTTTVYVTHDQIEAMTMADKIVVMQDGIVEQMGAPLDLYDHPENKFVAGFIGSPAMNFLEGTLRVNGGDPGHGAWVETANGAKLPITAAPAASHEKPVTYGIRPEHLEFADDGIEAEVIVVEPTGSETQIVARIGTQDIIAIFRDRRQVAPGDKIHLRPRASAAHLFDKDTGKRMN